MLIPWKTWKSMFVSFLKFCKAKNLKLKTDKFKISENVEFAGATLNAELVRGEQVVNILPKNGRIDAFQNLKPLRQSMS